MTGVLGDTVAKLTFDDEFQEKRKRVGSVRQGVEGAAMVRLVCLLSFFLG